MVHRKLPACGYSSYAPFRRNKAVGKLDQLGDLVLDEVHLDDVQHVVGRDSTSLHDTVR